MIKKYLLLTLGIISLVLGVTGIILPLLPTTPFLLLAAACFVNSSPKLYEWLMNNKVCGKYIRNYRENRGIPLRVKITSIAILWLSVSYSFFFMLESFFARLILLIIVLGVTTHILRMKTLIETDCEEQNDKCEESEGESQ